MGESEPLKKPDEDSGSGGSDVEGQTDGKKGKRNQSSKRVFEAVKWLAGGLFVLAAGWWLVGFLNERDRNEHYVGSLLHFVDDRLWEDVERHEKVASGGIAFMDDMHRSHQCYDPAYKGESERMRGGFGDSKVPFVTMGYDGFQNHAPLVGSNLRIWLPGQDSVKDGIVAVFLGSAQQNRSDKGALPPGYEELDDLIASTRAGDLLMAKNGMTEPPVRPAIHWHQFWSDNKSRPDDDPSKLDVA